MLVYSIIGISYDSFWDFGSRATILGSITLLVLMGLQISLMLVVDRVSLLNDCFNGEMSSILKDIDDY